MSSKSAQESGKFVSPAHRPPKLIPKYTTLWSQGHSVARRIMSMKNSSDTTGNRTRDLLAQFLYQLRHRRYMNFHKIKIYYLHNEGLVIEE